MKIENTHSAGSAAVVPHGKAELRDEAKRARAQLASTLDAIEYKLNLPKQLRITRRRMRLALIRLGDDNPLALVGIALGVGISVGAMVWVGANSIVSKRS